MSEIIDQISQAHRAVRAGGGDRDTVTRIVVVRRAFPAPIEDVWDACTTAERIGRWLMPVTGDLRLGGKYQLEGNAGGEILSCEPPRLLRVTWVMGEGPASEVEVRLAPGDGAETMLELAHTAVVDPEFWTKYGPGAVGVGWDLALLGLFLYLSTGRDRPEDPAAWAANPDAREFITRSSEAWGVASSKAGPSEAAAADRRRRDYRLLPAAAALARPCPRPPVAAVSFGSAASPTKRTTNKSRRGTAMEDRSRWVALGVLCTGMLMIVLDMTIVNVALPSIQADLGFSQSSLAWVVNAYLIAFAGLLLLAGRLGDLAGRRNVFIAGLGVFTVASLLCGVAANQEMLVAARFLQGIGGALTSAVILGMIVTMFANPREQAKAIGVFAFVASAGAAVGLLAGGILTQFLNWHWIFFVNLPIGVVTVIAARQVIEADRGAGLRAGADVAGALLITGAMMLGVFTIVGPAATGGWLAAKTLGFGAGSLVLLGGFLIRQHTARNPLMPLRIFASRTVTGANLVQVLGTAGMFGMFFLGSLYLRRILGYDPLQIGLAFLPVAVVMGTLSVRYTDRLVMRFGARPPMIAGLGLIAAGLALFASAPASGGGYLSHVFPVAVLAGTGAGLCFPALMALAMSSATPQDAGLASGLVNATAQVGGALGLAVLATVSASRTSALLAQHRPAAVALTNGYHLAFWIACGLVVAAAAVAATVLRSQPALAQSPERQGDASGKAKTVLMSSGWRA